MNLRDLLDLCQNHRAADWRVVPGGGPLERMLVGLVNASTSDRPQLATLEHYHRAVYAPNPQLGLAWGMQAEHERRTVQVDWKPAPWRSVSEAYAHVLLGGSIVWQVPFAQVNRGAGEDGVIAWPTQANVDPLGDPAASAGWWIQSWEASFAALLNTLAGNSFDPENEAARAGLHLEQGHPLDLR